MNTRGSAAKAMFMHYCRPAQDGTQFSSTYRWHPW
jgi:hypothetical protein